MTGEDKDVKDRAAQFVVDILDDPLVKVALVAVVSKLCSDREVIKAATQLAVNIIQKKEVAEVINKNAWLDWLTRPLKELLGA